MALTAKQTRFIAEYLIDLNATQAAIRSGYSAKTAGQQGFENLNKPEIMQALQVSQARQLENAELTAAGVKEAIRRQVYGKVRKLFHPGGKLKSLDEMTDEEAEIIGGFEVIIKNAEAGDGHTDTVHKVKLTDRARYVQMAAEHFALLTNVVRIEDNAGKFTGLYAGRKRAADAKRRSQS